MIRSIALALAAAGAIMAASPALAHGTDEPGPHGGEIRMPGAFHIEALARDNAVLLYLLDMQFERPRVADSSVEVVLTQDGREMRLDCRVAEQARAFRCPLPEDASLQRGTLKVDARRQGAPASTARYELPLAWSGDASAGASGEAD